MKYVFIILIAFYQIFLSPIIKQMFGVRCRFQKTCSSYALWAFKNNNVFKALTLTTGRIISCRPF